MSQIIMDPRPQVPASARESGPPKYGTSAYPVLTAPTTKSNGLSLGAIVCAVAGVVLSCIPLFVSGVPVALAIGALSVGVVLGVLATLLGAMGRGRAAARGLGVTGLVIGALALIWTIGGFACGLATYLH